MAFKGPIKTAQACKPGIFGDLFYGEIPKENGTGSRNLCAVQDVLKTFPAEFLQFNIQILVADGKASGNRSSTVNGRTMAKQVRQHACA